MTELKSIDLEGSGSLGSMQTQAPSPAAPAAGSTSGGFSVMQVGSWLAAAKHPRICLFHLLFKVAALVSYIFGRHIGGDYVMTFIAVTVFNAFDFWTVKNISGRILVGLRWWNDIKDDGSSNWIFESLSDESGVDPMDKKIFWFTIYIWPLVWLVFFVVNFIALNWDWVLLIVITLVFAASNVVGYWKCSKDQKKKIADWAKGQAVSAVVSNFF
mmetsp:Transcript_150072/g.273151  ORF Transcript_150072/g.273151 Transcript_150072/m.273151 type:complete len:214 (+) Transcript_150072:55-696(+)